MTDDDNITQPDSAKAVDIIVPVHSDLAATRRCVESVLSNTDMRRARLIIVDDATPEPALAAWCDELAAEPFVLLLRHERNKGFVAAVNLGMSQSDDRDVLLLNSDTEVPPQWLPRLQACAYSADDIATVTPFSNNGSICSYPVFCQSSELPDGLDLQALDALFSQANRGKTADLVTAVGFCMYIRRSCLQQFGLFDERQYGRGYGEENDFSLCVAAAGWRNCLCADLFVYHQGGASFGEDRYALMETGEARLLERYPDYLNQVAAFIGEDPLRSLRESVDDLRIALPGQAGIVLEEGRRRQTLLEEKLSKLERRLQDEMRAARREIEAGKRLLQEDREAARQEIESYKRLLQEDREAARQELQSCRQLLDEARGENREINEALGQAQQSYHQLEQAYHLKEQEIERLQGLGALRIGRWLKRVLRRQ